MYSPDNSNEEKRMPPEVLAEKIYWAMQDKKQHFVPGFNNKVFAFAGKFFPKLTEQMMKRIIFDKLKPG
jgi:short-subunit dehydrogenase